MELSGRGKSEDLMVPVQPAKRSQNCVALISRSESACEFFGEGFELTILWAVEIQIRVAAVGVVVQRGLRFGLVLPVRFPSANPDSPTTGRHDFASIDFGKNSAPV